MSEEIYALLFSNITGFYFLGRILLATVLGAVLGWQRERWGKAAGPRTYALVTVGAALFTVLATDVLAKYGNSISISAQIVTGIGFLGAGMILHRKNHVDGLTTAAGLWVAAAIGMAVGSREYLLAIGSTLIIFLILMVDDKGLVKQNKRSIIED